MNDISKRQEEILERVVQEHIKTALPVSSGFLKQKCHLSVSPATIRMDFVELTRAGFLEKHHISGGRVPTDKGYRFFVDNLFEKEDFEKTKEKISKEFQLIFKEINDVLRFSHEITKSLAVFSSNLGIAYLQDFDIFWKEGWEEVVRAPEFHDLEYLKKFTELVNDLEENIQEFDIDINEREKKIKIFIGKESPFKRKEFSIIGAKTSNLKNKATFAILGPKRMDFRRNISLIESLIKTIEKFNV